MKKIFILGTGRTASKFYKEILKKDENVYILHEIMFDFRYKVDINSLFKKYDVYKNKENLSKAISEIYSKDYFRNFQEEFPEQQLLIEELNSLKKLTWQSVLNAIVELKAKSMNKTVAGAKNPVHYSFAPKVVRTLKDVKILYLFRDPRSIYASEIPMKTKDSKLSQFPRLKSKTIQRILIFLYTNMEWIWSMIAYKRVAKSALMCKYEDMVKNYEEFMQNVFDYCEIPFKTDYLKEIGVIGSSHVKNTKDGTSFHGMKKWENMLNGFEKAWFKFLVWLFKY